MAIQSTALLVAKLPPTMMYAPLVVLEYTLIQPLSPDQLAAVDEYVTTTAGTYEKPEYEMYEAVLPLMLVEP